MLTLIFMIALFALPFIPPFDRADARPLWSKRRPREEGYWTGLGVARLSTDPAETRARARAEALRDIAAQIETRLAAEIYLAQREDINGLTAAYHSDIRSKIKAQLEQVEIVDTWDDGEYFWVYARMSIAAYQKRWQDRTATLRKLSAEHSRRATEMEDGDPAGALALHIRALELAQQLHRLDPAAQTSEITLRIQHLLMSIQLETTPQLTPIKSDTPVDIALQISAWTKGQRRPISGLPLSCRFARGNGEIDTRVWTGENGRASTLLHQIHSEEPAQTVVVRVDLSAFGPMVPHQRFNAPFAVFNLTISKRQVHLTYEGQPALIAQLDSRMRALLSRQGLDLVPNPEDADLLIKLKARVDEERLYHNLHFTFLDLELALRDRHSDSGIQRALNRVKGAGASYAQAQSKACDQAGAKIEGAVLPEALAALHGTLFTAPTPERNTK